MAFGQQDEPCVEASLLQHLGEVLRSLNTTAIVVGVKGQIDSPGSIAELLHLTAVEAGSERASNGAKASLPESGIIEESFDQDDFRRGLGLGPPVQATFGSGQETMWRCRGRNAAAVAAM